MRPKLLLISLAVAFIPALCAAQTSGQRLLPRDVRGCRTLDLKHWSHPTRRVLERDEIEIKAVELCNQGLYPVFTVALKYDPNGPNDKYYNRLYWELAEANGFHSFSLVDTGFGVVVNIAVKGKHEIAVDTEAFTPQASP